jgi:hypothetical protein
MYSLSHFFDKYCNMLQCHYFDQRKYYLKIKIVTLPIQYPALFIPT